MEKKLKLYLQSRNPLLIGSMVLTKPEQTLYVQFSVGVAIPS